jgi:hypothetical protein
MDEAGSKDGGQQPELTSDSPEVLEFIKFLDEFDERIEAHKRALCAHYPAAVADGAIGRRLQQSMRTVFDMRQAVTQLRSDIRNTRRIEYPVICDRLTEILKIGL